MSRENYWNDRMASNLGIRGWISRSIKSSTFAFSIASFFLSSRLSDEAVIRKYVRRYKPISVLDIACGEGKALLPALIPTVYGIDIAGFPSDMPLNKGYTKTFVYEPPKYEFELPRSVDMLTCINLNAHIPFSAYIKIVEGALKFLTPDGILILVNEYDNKGISYSFFSDPAKRLSLIRGMEHYYFTDRDGFISEFTEYFGELKMVEERSLETLVTLSQHYVYHTGKDPGPVARKLILLGDALLGPVNYLYTRFRPKCESFLRVHLFQRSSSINC